MGSSTRRRKDISVLPVIFYHFSSPKMLKSVNSVSYIILRMFKISLKETNHQFHIKKQVFLFLWQNGSIWQLLACAPSAAMGAEPQQPPLWWSGSLHPPQPHSLLPHTQRLVHSYFLPGSCRFSVYDQVHVHMIWLTKAFHTCPFSKALWWHGKCLS